MNYSKATNEQLVNIFLYDEKCPVELFAGLVKEINSRQLVDVYATMNIRYKKLEQDRNWLRKNRDKWFYKYDNVTRNNGRVRRKKQIEQLELHNSRLQVEIMTLKRKLRRAENGANR